MSKKWEICHVCEGEGSYPDWEAYHDDLNSYDDGPPMVPCRKCRGSGKLVALSPEQAQDQYEQRKLFCAESGIAPGHPDYNDIMENG